MAKSKKSSKSRNGGTGPIYDADGYEIIGGDSQGLAVGEVMEGIYLGVARTLPPLKKGEPPAPIYQIGPRSILGGTVLRMRFDEGGIKIGDAVKITRLEDAEAKKGQQPAKMFAVGVKRKKG